MVRDQNPFGRLKMGLTSMNVDILYSTVRGMTINNVTCIDIVCFFLAKINLDIYMFVDLNDAC